MVSASEEPPSNPDVDQLCDLGEGFSASRLCEAGIISPASQVNRKLTEVLKVKCPAPFLWVSGQSESQAVWAPFLFEGCVPDLGERPRVSQSIEGISKRLAKCSDSVAPTLTSVEIKQQNKSPICRHQSHTVLAHCDTADPGTTKSTAWEMIECRPGLLSLHSPRL